MAKHQLNWRNERETGFNSNEDDENEKKNVLGFVTSHWMRDRISAFAVCAVSPPKIVMTSVKEQTPIEWHLSYFVFMKIKILVRNENMPHLFATPGHASDPRTHTWNFLNIPERFDAATDSIQITKSQSHSSENRKLNWTHTEVAHECRLKNHLNSPNAIQLCREIKY